MKAQISELSDSPQVCTVSCRLRRLGSAASPARASGPDEDGSDWESELSTSDASSDLGSFGADGRLSPTHSLGTAAAGAAASAVAAVEMLLAQRAAAGSPLTYDPVLMGIESIDSIPAPYSSPFDTVRRSPDDNPVRLLPVRSPNGNGKPPSTWEGVESRVDRAREANARESRAGARGSQGSFKKRPASASPPASDGFGSSNDEGAFGEPREARASAVSFSGAAAAGAPRAPTAVSSAGLAGPGASSAALGGESSRELLSGPGGYSFSDQHHPNGSVDDFTGGFAAGSTSGGDAYGDTAPLMDSSQQGSDAAPSERQQSGAPPPGGWLRRSVSAAGAAAAQVQQAAAAKGVPVWLGGRGKPPGGYGAAPVGSPEPSLAGDGGSAAEKDRQPRWSRGQSALGSRPASRGSMHYAALPESSPGGGGEWSEQSRGDPSIFGSPEASAAADVGSLPAGSARSGRVSAVSSVAVPPPPLEVRE